MKQPNDTNSDELTRATTAVVWVIVANKPFYPLYIWWLIGSGVWTSASTMISIPFFLAIPFLARHSTLSARIALPVVGTFDTVLQSAIFGWDSATLLFLAPCAALAALSFQSSEKWWQRATVCLIFACFVACWWLVGEPAYPWDTSHRETLRTMNIFAVASLMGFIGLRYAGISRPR